MAVELRCPDCRAKLRLKSAPEAGTEVECPKCGTVFPAPEPEPEPDDDPPKKRAEPKEDGEKPKKEKTAKTKPGAAGTNPNAPRKRKAKKRETSKTALIGVICAGAIMIACMSAVLVWYFTRTSKAVEMFYYVPEDAQSAWGINLGHVQKYPVFYKAISGVVTGAPFKPAGDAIGKAAGTDLDGLVDYVAVAESAKNGSAYVFRTKTEFDAADLSKIPGAEKNTLDGKTYYTAPNLWPGNQSARVFAPTNRLVVVCPANTVSPSPTDATFKKMLNGHSANREKTMGVRMGALGKRVTRGTFWQLMLFDNEVKADNVLDTVSGPQDGKSNADDPKSKKRTEYSEGMKGSSGIGVKASLGSREVRFELVVAEKDGERASEYTKKMKESELGKGDEGTPPKWFKDDTSGFGDKKIGAQLVSNLAFGASGELFFVKSAVDTTDLQQSAARILGMVLGSTSKTAGGPGSGPPGMPGGPGRPPGGSGGPPGRPAGPKQRRRRGRTRC